ncbi:MAG: carboxypeptidase regulatory-like domain-containing protein, partial [Acidobacteria bacterium]
MLRRGGYALLLVLVFGGLALAQGTASRVLGQVVDASGGVIPGATVVLTNEGNGASFTMATTAAGIRTPVPRGVPAAGLHALQVAGHAL